MIAAGGLVPAAQSTFMPSQLHSPTSPYTLAKLSAVCMFPGGDAFLSRCIWKAGYGFTDPGYSFYHWEAKSFDPGPETSRKLVQDFSNALLSTCDASTLVCDACHECTAPRSLESIDLKASASKTPDPLHPPTPFSSLDSTPLTPFCSLPRSPQHNKCRKACQLATSLPS